MTVIRAATESDMAFVRSTWLRSFSASAIALEATPHTDEHVWRCSTCRSPHLKSRRNGTGGRVWAAGEVYWREQGRLIDGLLGCSTCLVAAEDEAPDVVVAFCAHSHVSLAPVRLHYVYVRRAWRGRGLARTLVGSLCDEPVEYTHRPLSLQPSRLPKTWIYNPYAAWLDAPQSAVGQVQPEKSPLLDPCSTADSGACQHQWRHQWRLVYGTDKYRCAVCSLEVCSLETLL